MALLSDFRVDSRAINEGKWVRVNETLYEDLEILTRGFTDDFIDAQNARLAKAAEPYNGDQTRIPNAVRRQVNAGLLRDFLVLNVRNLWEDAEKTQAVPVQDFVAKLGDQDYNILARACWEAAGRVSAERGALLKAAVGNSPIASATGSAATA
jgi:hypothetical protein